MRETVISWLCFCSYLPSLPSATLMCLHAIYRAIMFFSVHPCPILWTQYLKNAQWEFPHIWLKCPHGLKDELIFLAIRSKVTMTTHLHHACQRDITGMPWKEVFRLGRIAHFNWRVNWLALIVKGEKFGKVTVSSRLSCPSPSYESDIPGLPWGNFFRSDTKAHLDSRMNLRSVQFLTDSEHISTGMSWGHLLELKSKRIRFWWSKIRLTVTTHLSSMTVPFFWKQYHRNAVREFSSSNLAQ